jgi:hypothetical protein
VLSHTILSTHPLRQGFVPIEDIKEGEHLLSKAGIITVVSKTYDPTPQAVYNLEVGQWHNFLVGVSAVVVHNNYFEEIKVIVNASSDYSAFTKSKLLKLIEENPNLSYRLLSKQNGTFNQSLFDDMAKAVQNNKLFERVTDVDKVMKSNVKLIEGAVDDVEAVIGYRGSLTTGKSYASGDPFNPNKFDVDGFIVSDKLAAKFAPNKPRFVSDKISPTIANYQDMMELQFKNSVQGYGNKLNKNTGFMSRLVLKFGHKQNIMHKNLLMEALKFSNNMDKTMRIEGQLSLSSKLGLLEVSTHIANKLFSDCKLREIVIDWHDEDQVVYLVDLLGLRVKIYLGTPEGDINNFLFWVQPVFKRPILKMPLDFEIEYVNIEQYLFELFTETFKNDDVFVKISKYSDEVD